MYSIENNSSNILIKFVKIHVFAMRQQQMPILFFPIINYGNFKLLYQQK